MTASSAEAQSEESGERWGLVLRNPIVLIGLVVLLSFWTSYTLYRLRFGNLTGADLSFAYSWEGVVLLVPLPGVVAAVYGYLTGSRLRAVAVGLGPYAPLLALWVPFSALFFVPGIPMGLFGLSAATLKKQKRLTAAALLPFSIGAFVWLSLVALLMR